jgi:translation elongation factor EF-1alpha
MKLNLLERILLLQLLPAQEDIFVLKIIRDLKNNLSLTEEEHKEFNVQINGDNMTWNTKGKEERDISIGEKATDICIEALKKANKNKTLTEQHISLYDKFIN